MSRHQEFTQGARDMLPMLLGAIPFGIIFGSLAGAAGLDVWQTLGMSALVFAGSAQFIAITRAERVWWRVAEVSATIPASALVAARALGRELVCGPPAPAAAP